jgi:hypothetical protein
MEEDGIINRVSSSTLLLFDLEEYYHPGERLAFDIKDSLFQGQILKEKDFRSFVKAHDWSVMAGKNVAVWCSVEVIIPTWAYMLLVTAISPYANSVVYGDLNDLEQTLYERAFEGIDWKIFTDSKVVIKGCGKFPVPTFAYVEATRNLLPYASSIMYGEPCSTVPIYKKPKN